MSKLPQPVAWAMRRPDGLVLDIITPEEHESHEGEYTMPLYAAQPAPVPAEEFCLCNDSISLQFASGGGSTDGLYGRLFVVVDGKTVEYVRAEFAAPVPVPLTDEQESIINFLLGANDLEGVWFGDRHPTERGAFWWRNRLRDAFRPARAIAASPEVPRG